MKQAFEAAWLRAPEAIEAKGRIQKAQAQQLAAHSWVAAPTALSMSQREGQSGAPVGSRETDVGWSLPLWRPGQRAAGLQSAQAESDWANAHDQLARFRLYGLLRESAAAVHIAEVEMMQAKSHLQTLGQLVIDVERRVDAGDLAPADALAARAQWLGAQAQVHSLSQTRDSRRTDWQTLTGLEQVPEDKVLPDQKPTTYNHFLRGVSSVG